MKNYKAITMMLAICMSGTSFPATVRAEEGVETVQMAQVEAAEVQETAEAAIAQENGSAAVQEGAAEAVAEEDAIEVYASGEIVSTTNASYSYTLDEDGNATITKYTGTDEKIRIPETLDGYTVTKLARYVFQNRKNLTEVVLPDTITELGGYVFSGCEKLSEVSLPKSLTKMGDYTFNDCVSLTGLEIPKALERVGIAVFAGCTSLKAITFEEGITTIVGSLFTNCLGIEKIEIPDTVTVIEGYAFSGCKNLTEVVLPDTITELEGYVFQSCESLTAVAIPSSVKKIGTNLFADCSSLPQFVWPAQLTAIPTNTFYGCTSLKQITLPDSLECISSGAFQKTGLQEVTIPDSVTELQRAVFKEAADLKKVSLGCGITEIPYEAFEKCAALTEVVLPETITRMDDRAFMGCSELVSITLPDSVQTLGTYLFADCTKLSDIWLGTGITVIPEYMFSNCASLQKIRLPYRTTTIKNNAFLNTTKLTEIVMLRRVNTIDKKAFSYPAKLTIYGITGSYAEEYAKTAGAEFVHQEVKTTELALDCTEMLMLTETKQELRLTIAPADFTDDVVWSSSDEEILTVSDWGILEAKAPGKVTVTVTAGEKTATCEVTVKQPVKAIELNRGWASMEALDTIDLTATVLPGNATDKGLLWSSSDESIVKVDENGHVEAVAKGEAVITVTAQDGYGASADCQVTVTNNAYVCEEVSQLESAHDYEESCTDAWYYTYPGEADALEITFDEQTSLCEYEDYLYLYGEEGALIGSYTGTELAGNTIRVPGVEVKLQLYLKGAESWGFKVTDVKAVIDVTEVCLEKTKLELEEGQEETLRITVLPENATETVFTWSSSDESVATVEEGKVTAHREGTAVITVTTENGRSASCEVTVTAAIKELQLDKTILMLAEGTEKQLEVTVLPESAQDSPLTWSSSDEEVASVEDGRITTHKAGVAVITVTASNGVSASCEVTVKQTAPPAQMGDVDKTSWMYEPIQFAYKYNIMSGKGEDENGDIIFEPIEYLTREQFAQVIYNAEGEEHIDYADTFPDVPDKQWYTSAVLWAAKNEIANGYPEGDFGVGDNITREQFVVMLHNYATYKGYDTSQTADLSEFSDVEDIHDWALTQLQWAYANEIMSGKGGFLDPLGNTTRAECATMLYNFLVRFAGFEE